MLTLGQLLSSFVELMGVWVLFERFGRIEGWSFHQVCLLYGTLHSGFAFAEGLAHGFEKFAHTVKKGDFDRILLRPINPLIQIALSEIQLFRVGRLVQGLGILFWAAYHLHPPFWIVSLSVASAAALFYGLFVFQATFSFWTVESLEIMNIATYGGLQMGQYPLTIYGRPLRWVFTFLVPLASVSYYPLATIFQKEDSVALLPLAGFLFLLISLRFWRFGLRHYQSTGS